MPHTSFDVESHDAATLVQAIWLPAFADFCLEKAGLKVEIMPISTSEELEFAAAALHETELRSYRPAPGQSGEQSYHRGRSSNVPRAKTGAEIQLIAHAVPPSVPIIIRGLPDTESVAILKAQFSAQHTT